MFKRVGSIVLTVVMMFTMVCSTFALATPFSLDVRLEEGVTEVDAGETVKVYVDLGQSGTLSGITIFGTYNTEIFELEQSNVNANDFDGALMPTPVLDPSKSEDQIKVNWMGVDNVDVPAGNLVEMTFTVKADAETSVETFSFRFAEDGLSIVENNVPELMTPGVDFETEVAVSDAITVAPTVKPYLFSGINGNSTVAVGDTVEVYVQVNDYQDEWAGLVVEGTYDKDLFELTTVSPEGICDSEAIVVRDDANGKVSVGWIEAENIVQTEDNIVLFLLTFTAKAAGEASFNFSFKDGGVVSVGTGNVYEIKVAGTDYVKAAEAVEVEVVEEALIPGLTIEQTGNAEVAIGDEVNVEIGLDNYNGKWASMGIKIAYDPAVLQVTDVTPNPFGDINAVIVYKDGEILITWISDSNVSTAYSAIAFASFEAIAAGDTTVSVDYIDDSVISIGDSGEYNTLVKDTDYIVTTGSADVTVEDVSVPVLPALSIPTTGEIIQIGEELLLPVRLNHYNGAFAAITFEGNYDPAVLELQEFRSSVTDAEAVLVLDETAGTFAVSLISAENLAGEGVLSLGTLVFKGKAAGADTVTAELKDEGVLSIGANGEYIYAVAGTDYVEFTATSEVTVEEEPPAPTTPYLDVTVENGLTEVEEGAEFNVTVDLKGYNSDWAALTVEGAYNKDVFELTDVASGAFGSTAPVIVKDEANGKLSAVWMNAENVDAETDSTLLTLTFKAIAEGTGDFNFNFKEGGVLSIGTNGEYITLVKDTDYIEAADTVTVDVTERQPNAAPYLDAVVVDDVTTVEKGETVSVEVYVNEYADDWAGLTIEGTFNKDVFELTTMTPGTFGTATATPVVDNANGKLSVNWMNTENVDAEIEFKAITLVFTAKAAGEGDFNFNFKDGGIVTIDGNDYVTLQPETDYVKASNELTVTVTDSTPATVLKPTIAVDGDQTEVKQGETVTLIVGVEDYTEVLTGITFDGTFDANIFELDASDFTCESFTGMTVTPVVNAANNKYSVSFFGTGIATGNDTMKFFEVTLTAKQDAVLGDTDLGISFRADGMADANGELLDGAKFDPDNKTVTVTVAEGEEPECTHDWTGTPVHKAGTSGEFSKHVFTCTLGCGETKEVNCSIDTSRTPATCTQAGTITYDCELCEYVETVTDPNAPALDHDWNVTPVHDDTTAGATSKHIYTCGRDNCEETKEEGCSFSEFKRVPATCTTAEKITYKCDGCGYEYTVDGESATDHDWNVTPVHDDTTAGATSKHIYTCGNGCGETKDEGCSFSEIGRVPADCDTVEKITYECTLCGYEYTVDGEPALDHDWSGQPAHKNGTSGMDSKHVYTCGRDNCEETKEEDCTVTATPIAPTDTEYGKIHYHCDVCGYDETVDDLTQPPVTHNWSTVPTHKDGTTGTGSKHVYTCTDPGCSETKEESCDFTSEVFKPTCSDQGHTTYTCKDCGYVYTDNYVPALPAHTNVVTRYYAADRTAGGASGWIDEFCYGCNHRVGEATIIVAGQVFPDVSTTAVESAWYYDAVAFCKAFGIFGGDDKGNFNPTQNITRGQMVTVLGRMMMPEAEKQMSASAFNAYLASQGTLTSTPSTNSLNDVSGAYYERYAKLLAKWGIVTGYEDGSFRGDNPITRQEMATLLKRFVEAYTGTSNVQFGKSATFADMASVDAWAKANVQWAGQVGLFQGDQNKNYNPHSNATRAEIAVVISRMLPVLDGIEIVRMTGNI